MSKPTLFDKLKFEEDYKHQKENESENQKSDLIYKSLIFGISILICTFLFVFHRNNSQLSNSELSYNQGLKWNNKSIIADFTFQVYKDKNQYQKEIKLAQEQSPKVFYYNENAIYSILNKASSITTQLSTSFDSTNSLTNYTKFLKNRKKDEVKKIFELVFQNIKNYLISNYKPQITSNEIEKIKQNYIIIQTSKNIRNYILTDKLIDSTSFIEISKKYFDKKSNSDIANLTNDIFQKSFITNLSLSKDLTEIEKQNAKNSVAKTLGFVRKGETIINKGDRINSYHILKLQSYYNSKNLSEQTENNWLDYIIGFVHISIIFSFIFIYLFIIRKRIFADNRQLISICTLLVLIAFQAWISIELNTNFPIEFLILLPAFSMLSAIILDSRTSFNLTVTMVLLLAAIRGNDYITSTIMFFAGFLAGYTVRDIQSRTQVFKSVFVIFIGLVLPILVFNIEKNADWTFISIKIGFAFLNAIISPIITFGLLFVFERFSDFASDLRLQEFENLKHPLLIKMSEVAPGTYQHSLGVAMLAEKCAAALDANQLYCKVSSYFHDIGKIERPEYFAENQIGMTNKHNLLPAKKSAQYIIAHVTEGVELAIQYKLPKRLIDIIYMHHGTSLVQHFYAKALETGNPELINELDFRYPGPKPNTKEAAIVMVCDTAEAISRLGIESTDQLEKMLDNIIKDKINDGQFDDCEISMQELQIIKITILRSLIGASHKRVQYKEIPKDKLKKEDSNTN